MIARGESPSCATGEIISFSLPWPPSTLSPNKRQHWGRLAGAKKKYRSACAIAAMEQKVAKPAYRDIDVRLVFVAPDRRTRDRDNLVASMKSGLDGVCDALGIDDKRFARVSAEMAEHSGGEAMVRVFLSAFERRRS